MYIHMHKRFFIHFQNKERDSQAQGAGSTSGRLLLEAAVRLARLLPVRGEAPAAPGLMLRKLGG